MTLSRATQGRLVARGEREGEQQRAAHAHEGKVKCKHGWTGPWYSRPCSCDLIADTPDPTHQDIMAWHERQKQRELNAIANAHANRRIMQEDYHAA